MNNNKIINVAEPTNNGDVTTKNYTDNQDTSILNQSKSYTDTAKGEAISQSNTYTDNKDLNSFPISSGLNMDFKQIGELPLPLTGNQATNKGYVDAGDQNQKNYTDTTLNTFYYNKTTSDNRYPQFSVTDSLQSQVNGKYSDSTKLNQIQAPDGNVSLGNNRITNLADPVDN